MFPYTRILLENPIIVRNSHAARVHVRAVTDAAVAAAGTTINPDGLRGLGRVRRTQDIMKEQRRTRLGLDLPDYNGDDAVAWTETERSAIETVRRTAGGISVRV